MRDQHAVACKFEKGGDRRVDLRRVRNHLVGDAGQLRDLFGDGHLGVDEGVEAVQHLALTDAHRADLGDAAVRHRETGGLNIEDDKLAVQPLVAFAVERAGGVVHKIGFHAVDDLHAALLFGGEHHLGEGLHVTVVGDGDGGMPPALCRGNGVGGVDDGVHLRHDAVHVQLHALFLGFVGAQHGFDLHDVLRAHDVLAEEVVAAHTPVDGVALAGLHVADKARLLLRKGGAQINRGIAVRDADGDIGLVAAAGILGLDGVDLAHDDEAAGAGLQFADRRRRVEGELIAEDLLRLACVKGHAAAGEQTVTQLGCTVLFF